MQVKTFIIPFLSPEWAEEEVNKFLRSHRVLQVDRQFSAEQGGVWTLLITYKDGDVRLEPTAKKEKVDYREVLSEEEFARFSKLREIRKTIAQQESVPPYVIFTDEELSILSKPESLSLNDIKGLKGVGEKKSEKYGPVFLEQMK